MTNIDKQRVAAVRMLEQLGHRYDGRELGSAGVGDDSCHPAFYSRRVITDAIEAYEAVRWPAGKVPGGKG